MKVPADCPNLVGLTDRQLKSFFSRINDEWLWTGYIDKAGYGRLTIGQTNYKAHRLMYMLYKGDIDKGLHVHHIDHVRLHVHPDNLEALTPQEHGKVTRQVASYRPAFRGTVQERIAHYSIPQPNGCIYWDAAHTERGRPQIGIGGKTMYVARVVLAQRLGRHLEPWEQARHVVCGDPRCINPYHLEPGAHAQNMEDKARDGSSKGSNNGRAILNAEQVIEIRRLHADEGLGPTELGRRFGVDRTTVGKIVRRKVWAWLK